MSEVLHIGSIEEDGRRLYTVVKKSRPKLIYELNNWLFDFFRTHNLGIIQLPPLDDFDRKGSKWVYSMEDPNDAFSFVITLETESDL